MLSLAELLQDALKNPQTSIDDIVRITNSIAALNGSACG